MIHLHTHSFYSCLDGLGSVNDICRKAQEQGSKAIGITDHASISCLPDFFRSAKEHNVNPILGCEFYVTDTVEGVPKENRYHLTAWAKNWKGVQSIMRQLTLANKQFYYRPRLTWKQALDFDNCFIGTACCFGVLSHVQYDIIYLNLHATYKDDLFLEIMPHTVKLDDSDVDLQALVNGRALSLKRSYGGNLLLTNDAHYVNESDQQTHRLLLATQYRKPLNDFEGWGGGFHIRSMTEMIVAADKAGLSPESIKEGIESGYLIADQVQIEKPKFHIHLPSIYPNDNDAFAQIIMDGWNHKINGIVGDTGVYLDRMVYEISMIQQMDFVRYFLIVHDIISWSRANGITVGPGRGSSSGSLVCYLCDITQIDPIRHRLYFERFLNPSRVEMPDIDIDFQDDRRQEVFDYMETKYGGSNTAHINAFSSLSIKSAFRDVSRAYSINPLQVNGLSKQIEDAESFNSVPELMNFKNDHSEIVEHSLKLNGVIRQTGTHACGFVISSEPLENVCVLERRKNTGSDKEFFVTNWDKRESEKFGLLKVDILGLSTLSVLSMTRDAVSKRTGKFIEFEQIPLDDPNVLKLFQEGNTVGIFQFEGGGMIGLLKSMNPKSFTEITQATALYRPGSLQSGQTDRYVRICKGGVESYPSEKLRDVLSETKSVLVYQEQVIEIFNKLGGFTLSEADIMRKIIGKKLGVEEFEKHREHFVQGCLANGVSETVSNELFTVMVEFSGYAFNKAHATAYAAISMYSAYFKTYYPTEFMAALLTYASDDRIAEIIEDADRLGISLMPPDINISEKKYVIDTNNNIRYPLSAIKGIGTKAVDSILKVRIDGAFKSLDDLKDRVESRACNKRVVELLVNAGAFESLGQKESNEAERNKNLSTLIAGYTDLSKIVFGGDYSILSAVEHSNTYTECSTLNGKIKNCMLPSVRIDYSGIMIINNFTKKQRSIAGGEHNRYLFSLLSKVGIKEKEIYYTSPLKCESSKAICKIKCYDGLKQEILLLKPALILCLATDVVTLFDKSGKMAKLNGRLVYNAEFNTHVLFSYSPQYALYKGGEIQDNFEKNIAKLAKLDKR